MNRLRQLKDKLLARIITRYPSLLHRWAKKNTFITYSDSPWAELKKPLQQCKVALITTGGVHLRSQQPFDMSDPDGDPTFREIPSDTVSTNLMITHNYYDHRDADADINIVLPVDRIRDLLESGEIGDINHRYFSFMGHIAGGHVDTLIHDTATQVADSLTQDGVDIVILTPT